jgi:hypothetical protein
MTSIKFNRYYVTNGTTKARVHYYSRPDGVVLYAKDYGHALGEIFPDDYNNDSDLQSDYFDKGCVTIYTNDPRYAAAKARTDANDASREGR